MNILLVEPDFPISNKSKNHSTFLPIGLLKLVSLYRTRGHNTKLIRGNQKPDFIPDEINITSLFTYWSIYVKESVDFYRNLFPNAKIIVGGIYATLLPEHCKEYTKCDEVFIGQNPDADKCMPAYDLVDVDYQILHGMRGCKRACSFCGIWRIEKESYKTAKEVESEICRNKLIFYDNNILANPHITDILEMLSIKTYNNRVLKCECQSGFDGRILEENPGYATLLKKARFENIRLAWDFKYESYPQVENWIKILEDAGYNKKDIFIFMIYNWSFDYAELERKRKKCYEWGVQIADCRFRPLNQTTDNYNSHLKKQTNADYYIHENWTDSLVRKFRASVRKHNICIRYRIPWSQYERNLERTNSKHILKKEMSIVIQ
jgi:hypothetical protein